MDSVLAQTYVNFEVIVVDDGSTDLGADQVRNMHDSRIRLISQNNAGVSAARNYGIRESSHETIAFLDADDEWEPSFLETVVGLCNRYPRAGMCATAYRICRDGVYRRPEFSHCVESPDGGLLDDYFRAAFGTPPVHPSAVLVPRWVLDDVGGFPVGVSQGEDRHMWARIALRYRVAWAPQECAVYHLTADNRASEGSYAAPDLAVGQVIEEFLLSGAEPVSPRLMVEEYLVVHRLRLALECYLQGETLWAEGLLKKTSGTSLFRFRRIILQLAFRIPPRMLRGARRGKGSFRWLLQAMGRRSHAHSRRSGLAAGEGGPREG